MEPNALEKLNQRNAPGDEMQVVTIVAASAPEAVAQIRARLGAAAIVLNVRPLPRSGLSQFWRMPLIEVVACAPVAKLKEAVASSVPEPVCSDEPVQHSKFHVQSSTFPPSPDEPATDFADQLSEDDGPVQRSPFTVHRSPFTSEGDDSAWQAGRVLEKTGLLPRFAQHVVEELCKANGDAPPPPLHDQLAQSREVLKKLWRSPAPAQTRWHLFVGAPGVGKTTCLCKWLTQAVLLEDRTAHVLRLDGRAANTAEFLNVYCEILGVPAERSRPAHAVLSPWEPVPAAASPASLQVGRVSPSAPRTNRLRTHGALGEARPTAGPKAAALLEPDGEERFADAELVFLDLPGVDWRDAGAVRELAEQVADLPGARVHLVLNAAYDTAVLFSQVRAFGALPISDLVFTHLDEEPRPGKLWNFVLGAEHAVGFLSAGQNIPGTFEAATPEKLLARQFPRR
jgi:flagellar biosynthesis GTPase FlhF